MLRNLDTSLVIAAPETDSPVRQSRRIAQQKVREETDRRRIEEKLLKQMKADAERKKKGEGDDVEDPSGESSEEEENSKDATYVDEKKKKKKKLKPLDKPWQTSSDDNNVSEPEEEDYMLEQRRSDHGSPLFRSDHEFSCESDVENGEGLPVPTKRARTAKKTKKEEASSSDEEEINPNHLCQVCHTPDHPEWILLCDDCDHGYHCACLKPVLFLIPEGDWFCPKCQHKKLIDNLTKHLAVFDERLSEFELRRIETEKQDLIEAERLEENEVIRT